MTEETFDEIIDVYDNDEYDEYSTEVVIDENNTDINYIMKNYKKNKKKYKTIPILTKYEKCKVLSERANQINYGSQILIPNHENYTNSYDIAVAEFNEKKIPFIIKRPYGNSFEYWKLNDLL